MTLRLRILLVSLCMSIVLLASTATDAEKYYRAGEWAKAETLYAQLLKRAPSNRIYNHRYGVTLCEQSKDLATAEKHLKRSKRAGITISAFYLGRVCFLQYKFDDAIAYYTFYKSKTKDRKRKQAIEAQLPKCEQGKEMLERVEDVKILDRVEVDREGFFLNYKISKEAGSFLKDAADIGEDSIADNSTIYITERGDRAFFAIPNEEGVSNLYSKNKLLDQWADKTSLGNSVNTDEDEAYPFLMSDGIMLYFSSKGHSSFGGYDIYVTRYNASQNTYLPPQQLGMPFNSLGDDILFAIDEYNNIGWFASDRASEEGKIAIYTFEPNSTYTLLETDNEQERIRAAMISGDVISNATVSAVDSTTPQIVEPVVEVNHEIYFVIHDTLIYSDLNDFMSHDARALYVKYEQAATDYDSITAAVASQRLKYSRVEDSNEKAALISAIMQMEESSYTLEEERDKLMMSSRRIEVETIRANGGYVKPKPTDVAAPIAVVHDDEEHTSPWENPLAKVEKEVTKPFFYTAMLYDFYDQVYSSAAVDKLVKAHQMKVEAGNKQFLADYVIREYNKPVPEEQFFNKLFSYDTTFTPRMSESEIVNKVKRISADGAGLFVEANYLSFYTLKGQNVLLLETVKDEHYRNEIQGLMTRAAHALQQADQKIYVSEGVYTNNKQSLSQGNNFLKEGIQMLEASTMSYLKYRYDTQNKPQANRLTPVAKAEPQVVEETVSEVSREEIPAKQIKQPTAASPKEEYRIQFGTFSRHLKEGDVKLSELSHYKLSGKELYKYYTGHYKTQMDAAIGLEEVKSKGFKDAFVVKFIDGIPQ